ncbi:MAG: molecular chaperone TorD family protein [Motiliproteus sp.]
MITPTRSEMLQMAKARANVYGLLAAVFREEPSAALLSSLSGPEFSAALKSLNLSLDEVTAAGSDKQIAEDLALEYTRLFIGPGPRLSPHESLHIEARFGEENALWGPTTVAVKKFIEGAGLTIDETFDGMPDHISAEFEFMQQLLEKEAQAWRDQEDALAENILNIEKKFYDEHLSQWVCRFCDKTTAAAPHAFYKLFSAVTKSFVIFEEGTLKEIIDAADLGQPLVIQPCPSA